MNRYSLKAVLVVLYLSACIQLAQASIRTVLYKVEVITSSERGAGTDANVYIKIYGSLGNTDQIHLTKPGNLFERGSHDVFSFTTNDVGNPITRVAVMRDTNGLFSSWKLDKIVVNGTASYEFAFNEWIPANAWRKGRGKQASLCTVDGSYPGSIHFPWEKGKSSCSPGGK